MIVQYSLYEQYYSNINAILYKTSHLCLCQHTLLANYTQWINLFYYLGQELDYYLFL